MAKVSFTMGKSNQIDQISKKQGQVFVATDTEAMLVDIDNTNRIKIGGGEKTSENGEIFNLYEDTQTSLGTIGGIEIGSQTLPKNQAGEYAHAEGVSTAATGRGSHAEGAGTKADAEGAHAEGAGTLVTGAGSHAEGRGINFSVKVDAINDNVVTVTSNNSSITLQVSELEAIKKNAVIFYETNSTNHDGVFYYATMVELEKFLGVATACKITLDKTPIFDNGAILTVIMGGALSYISHTEGNYNNAVDIEATNLYGNNGSSHQRQHAEGSRTLSLGYASHSEGEYTIALGDMSHAEGNNTKAEGAHSHAEGQDTNAIGLNSHAEGWNTFANVKQSHAEGWNTFANGQQSHAEGCDTKANADNSHAEGSGTEAHGTNSHAEGYNTRTWASNAHAEGHNTSASGASAHAEGHEAKASGENAHAEGNNTKASGKNSHAEGESTIASGENAHAEGNNTKAWANNSHVSGLGTRSTRENQNVCGNYNKDNDDAIHIVGNGTDENNRSNAFEVYADGHAEVQTMGENDNSVVTKGYIDNALEESNYQLFDLGNYHYEGGLQGKVDLILSHVEGPSYNDRDGVYGTVYTLKDINSSKGCTITYTSKNEADTVNPNLIVGNKYRALMSPDESVEQGSWGFEYIKRQVVVEQSYNSNSEYAQSGKAVAEAIANMANSLENRIAKLEAAIIALGGTIE